MLSRRACALALTLVLAFAVGELRTQGQAVETPGPESAGLAGSGGRTIEKPAPWTGDQGGLLRGLNAGVAVAGVHDSYLGWYMIVTPFLSETFSQHYSADASLSVYPYRYVDVSGTGANSAKKLAFAGGDLGDLLLEAHAVFTPKTYRSVSTFSLTLPTGNRADGLGTGRATFSANERLERYFGRTGFLLDAGGGDSSALQNRLVTEDDTALGPLALFQAGLMTSLPLNMSMQSVAYEQLPLGDQKTYTALSRPGFPDRIVVSGHKVNEDNGFNTTLYIPLSPRLTLSGSYNRSLRMHLDTASTGLTFVWKGTPIARRESIIDRAMREAEADGVR